MTVLFPVQFSESDDIWKYICSYLCEYKRDYTTAKWYVQKC